MNNKFDISLLVPVFNEQESIKILYEELKKNYKDLEIRKDKLKEEIKSNGGKVSNFE